MYDGKILNGLPLPKNLHWELTELIFIEGIQPCGHVILRVPPYNFHFNGPSVFEYPKMMTDPELDTYLGSRHKHIMFTYSIDIPNPKTAEFELHTLMQNKWKTHIVAHNCATFAKSVIHAGGNNRPLIEYCPLRNEVSARTLMEEWFMKQL